jgi:hypothetical protein
MRRLHQARLKLLNEPRLAETRFANDLDELTLAGLRALPAAGQKAEFLLTADERRYRPRAAPPPAAAPADDPKELDRLGYAFEFAWSLLLNDKKSGDLSLDVHGDEH